MADGGKTETLSGNEGGNGTLGREVRNGMFHAFAEWVREHGGQANVREARMHMWEQIQNALPSGSLKDLHGNTRRIAEIDAQVAQWTAQGKDWVWGIARNVIAPEFPAVLVLPHDTPSVIDAFTARASGNIGEAVIKGSVAAYKGVEGALGATRRRIDAAMASIRSGSAVPAGGAA